MGRAQDKRRDPARCRTGEEFLACGEANGLTVRRGRHAVLMDARGHICPVPTHPGPLADGTRRSILAMFAKMGIAGLVFLVAGLAAAGVDPVAVVCQLARVCMGG